MFIILLQNTINYLRRPVKRAGRVEIEKDTGKLRLKDHVFSCGEKVEFLLDGEWYFGTVEKCWQSYYFKEFLGEKNTFDLKGLQARIRY